MSEERDWTDQWSLPALLRAARSAYGMAIRAELADAGCGDVPRDGIFVISAIVRTGAPLGDVIRHLGVSKQAAGQLVDALVLRGYLVREVDPEDRRRLVVTLTGRGEAAAAVIRSAVQDVDAELERAVGTEYIQHTRAALAALAAKAAAEASRTGTDA